MANAKYIKIGDKFYSPAHPMVKRQVMGMENILPVPTYDKLPALKKRVRQSSKKMNSLEADFQSYLKLQYTHVYYEPMRMRLCNGVVYIPDFMVTHLSGHVYFYEVKGNQPIQDDSSVKLKMAAQQYPLFKFVLVWRERGGWKEQAILP